MILNRPAYLRNYTISYLILLILPALPFLVGAKLQWVVHLLLIFTLIFESKKIGITKYSGWILLLLIPAIWAFFSSLDAEYYYIIQSLFYLLTPYLMVNLGIQFGGIVYKEEDLYKYIIYHGSVGAILFLGIGLFTLGTAAISDIYRLRNLIMWGSITNVAAIILMLFHKNHGYTLVKNKFWFNILLWINILALALTASRTYYIIFFIFLFLVLYKFKRASFFIIVIFFIMALIAILSIKTDNLLIVKIQNSVSEISNTREFAGYDDVNAFYRAYETQQAMKTYNSGNDFQLLFGQGLEKQVDLNIYVELAGTYRRVIPVLHNGYAYLLLRTGIMGILFYFVFFIRAYFIKKNRENKFTHIIYRGAILALLISNYVIGTFFSTEMSIAWIVIGFYLVIFKKENRLKST